jgi:hypothetical protein
MPLSVAQRAGFLVDIALHSKWLPRFLPEKPRACSCDGWNATQRRNPCSNWQRDDIRAPIAVARSDRGRVPTCGSIACKRSEMAGPGTIGAGLHPLRPGSVRDREDRGVPSLYGSASISVVAFGLNHRSSQLGQRGIKPRCPQARCGHQSRPISCHPGKPRMD